MEEPREKPGRSPGTPSPAEDESQIDWVERDEDDVTAIIIARAPQTECPICARAAAGPADRPCGHLVFTTDPTGYTGTSFALQYCHVYIERRMPPDKTFLEIDQEIILVIRQHAEIVNSRGYSTSPKETLDAAAAPVRSYRVTLGYVPPE